MAEVVLALVRLVGDDYDVLLVAQVFEHPPKNAVSLSTPRCTTLFERLSSLGWMRCQFVI